MTKLLLILGLLSITQAMAIRVCKEDFHKDIAARKQKWTDLAERFQERLEAIFPEPKEPSSARKLQKL